MKKTAGLFAYGEMGLSVLKALNSNFDLKWIILPKNQTPIEAETENLAKKLNLTISYIFKEAEIYDFIKRDTPNVIITATFNKLISQRTIKLTKFINIHLGDLPKYRGRANVNWAIINDRKNIGVTIHELVPAMDAGNIYKMEMISISETDNVNDIYIKINNFLYEEFAEIVTKVLSGFNGKKQNGIPSFCCTRLPIDGYIDWNKKSKEIYNLIRGVTKPYPGAFTYFNHKKMIIWSAELVKNTDIYEGRIPGRIISIKKGIGVEVLTVDSILLIKDINFEGKDINSSEIIKSVKNTLGINLAEIYEKLYES